MNARKPFLAFAMLLLAAFLLNAQQEIPMFFGNELGFTTNNRYSKLAYSPDGSKIATIFNEDKIVIWNATTGREIARLSGHDSHSISVIVFSPDSRLLASCSKYSSNIRIWDATSGALMRSINQAGMVEVLFNPDSNHLVGRYFEGNVSNGIKVWNLTNGSEILKFSGRFLSVAYSPDGKRILAVSQDSNAILILDANNGQIIRTINNSNNSYFEKAIYIPNGRNIAANDWNEETDFETMRIYMAETGQEIRSISINNYLNPYKNN